MSAGISSTSDQPLSFPAARQNEWDQLAGLLRDLQDQRAGTTALVSGAAGIGKTTLVDALAQHARNTGVNVLTASAYDLEAPPPYGLWQELFRSARNQTHLPAPPLALLDYNALEQVSGMRELWDLTARQILDIADSGPILIVLEDLHWADQPSIELLRYIARLAISAPVLIVATYRDVDLTPAYPLYHLLPHLVRELRPVRLALPPLGPDGAREIVEARYPSMPSGEIDRLTNYLDSHTEGNPLFIIEFLGLLEDTGSVRMIEAGWSLGELPEFAVPPLIRQIIEGRIGHLGPSARRALQLASVFGMDVPLHIWQRISMSQADSPADALEEVLQTRVLRETAEVDTLRFHHALVRDTIYLDTNIIQRSRWHARIGAELAERRDADPSLVAHHFVQAEDPRAIDWLIESAQRAGRAFALQAMITDYERALALLHRFPGRPADEASVLCALAEANRFTNTRAALDYSRAALNRARMIDEPGIGVLARWVDARVRGFDDQHALEGLIEAATAFDQLADASRREIAGSPLGYVVSDATLSQDLANYGMFTAALERAERFLKARGAPTARSQYLEFGNAYFGMGIACAALGDPERATTSFDTARRFFSESGSFQMVSNCYYWEMNAVAAVYYPDQPERRHRLQADEVQANLNSEFIQTDTGDRLDSTSDTLILDGEWDACRRLASLRISIPASRVPSARKLAEIEWLRGNPEAAWEHVRSTLPAGPDEPPGRRFFIHRQELQWVAANLALDNADEHRARRWIEAYERWATWSKRTTSAANAHLLWSRLHSLQGDPDAAFQRARAALIAADDPPQPLARLRALRAIGEIQAQLGNPELAARYLNDALAIAQACDTPYELAMVQLVRLESNVPLTGEENAASILAHIRETAERLGARPLIARVDALETLAQTAADVPEELPLGLTARQLEVLRLLATGRTDAEIAAELYISPRTVHRHLSAIYDKLDVDSRTAAVARAFAEGAIKT